MKPANRVTSLAAALLAVSVLIPAGSARLSPVMAAEKTLSQIYREHGKEDVDFQKVPPVRMFDNLWYVGPGYVSVYLIKTSAGLILIDASEEPDMVLHVIDSIHKAGFDPKDIKDIIISHGHIDHWGGIERIRALSGAPVYATDEDWKMIEDAASKPGPGGAPPKAPKRDRVVKDGDVLTLGDTTLKLYKTPGHTPGVISVLFTVYDNGAPHTALYSGGTGGRPGVQGYEEAVASTARLEKLDGVEVFLPNHGWNPGSEYPNGSLFERFPKLVARKAGDPNPFVDAASWKQFLAVTEARNKQGLEREKAKAAGAPAGGTAEAN